MIKTKRCLNRLHAVKSITTLLHNQLKSTNLHNNEYGPAMWSFFVTCCEMTVKISMYCKWKLREIRLFT